MKATGCPHEATNATHNSKTANTKINTAASQQQLPRTPQPRRLKGSRSDLGHHQLLLCVVCGCLLAWFAGCEANPIVMSKSSNASQQQAEVAGIHTELSAAAVEVRVANRTRLNKRSFRSEIRDHFKDTKPDWENPCGGKWNKSYTSPKSRFIPVKKIMRLLHNGTHRRLTLLREEIKGNAGGLGMGKAGLYLSNHLGCLPHANKSREYIKSKNLTADKPERRAQARVRHWHRQIQFFVAYLRYMLDIQLYWDDHNLHTWSDIANELRRLRNHAMDMQCSLEETFWSLSRYRRKHPKKVNTMSISTIENSMQCFVTKMVPLHNAALNAYNVETSNYDESGNKSDIIKGPQLPNYGDLILLKRYYYKYLSYINRTTTFYTKSKTTPAAIPKVNLQYERDRKIERKKEKEESR